jgi:hypothetical protein
MGDLFTPSRQKSAISPSTFGGSGGRNGRVTKSGTSSTVTTRQARMGQVVLELTRENLVLRSLGFR